MILNSFNSRSHRAVRPDMVGRERRYFNELDLVPSCVSRRANNAEASEKNEREEVVLNIKVI